MESGQGVNCMAGIKRHCVGGILGENRRQGRESAGEGEPVKTDVQQ